MHSITALTIEINHLREIIYMIQTMIILEITLIYQDYVKYIIPVEVVLF